MLIWTKNGVNLEEEWWSLRRVVGAEAWMKKKKGNMGETEWKQDEEFDEEENEVEWMPENEEREGK